MGLFIQQKALLSYRSILFIVRTAALRRAVALAREWKDVFDEP
jgi:hypothetical protein